MNLQEQTNRIKQMMGLQEQVADYKTAVIEILAPLAFMSEKYRFQSVPFWKTLEKNIYINKGPSGRKTISTDDIKVIKVFDKGEEDKMEEFLNKLREKETGEKWIKCDNCNKRYTQTIYKGRKSLPICPHCGTHDQSN